MPVANACGGTSEIPADEIRTELQKILASTQLARCPQLQRLLNFLVEEKLAGRGEQLKEYVLAVGVFGRPADFDPRLDSLVRVEARRLRATLEKYYQNQGGGDSIHIELQKGSYLPVFRRPAPVDLSATSQDNRVAPFSSVVARNMPWLRNAKLILLIVSIAAVATVTAFLLHDRRVQALSERDSIVIGEVLNSTGDPSFDDALKQGLTMALEQSPFLNIISERRTGQVLKLMGRQPNERLNPELAREVCLRTASKATVAGSIGLLGNQYVLGLTATNCSSGDAFAHLQVQAGGKESVLKALGTAASSLRGKLGESLSSIQKFDAPIEEVTTPSLEALQAYSLGRQTAREKGSPSDIPLYKRALELDPDFAVAYAALGVSYVNLGQPSIGSDYVRKAYDLREHVSEREKYRISAYYYHTVLGDLDKASQVYELWKQSYPRDVAAYINLGIAYVWLGQYEKSLTEMKEALRLEPTNVLSYTNVAALYIKLGRPEEAQAVLQQSAARNLTSKFLRSNLGYLAFLRNDPSVMERQLAEVRDRPGDEDPLLSQQSDTEAYFGRLHKAREFSQRAVDAAVRAGAKEAAAGWLVNAALREVECENAALAQRSVFEALQLASGRDIEALAALALARAGDLPQSEALLRQLENGFPSNTAIAVYWSPIIRAAIETAKGHPSRALELLDRTAAYDFASPPPLGLATMYPVYLRGEAYLLLGQGGPAARQFQKIVDRPYLVLNFPLHALARLQLARARARIGDQSAARNAYQDFFTLWQDADTDIPVLTKAKNEYSHMQ